MITTQIPEVDAMIAELEACQLGMLEANILKAGEIARLKARVTDLEGQVKAATLREESAVQKELGEQPGQAPESWLR